MAVLEVIKIFLGDISWRYFLETFLEDMFVETTCAMFSIPQLSNEIYLNLVDIRHHELEPSNQWAVWAETAKRLLSTSRNYVFHATLKMGRGTV